MKTSLLMQVRPQSYARFIALPILGSIVEEFVEWLSRRGYKRSTIGLELYVLKQVVQWLQTQHIRTLPELTEDVLTRTYDRCHGHGPNVGGTLRELRLFLCERKLIARCAPVPKPPSEKELESFATHLRDVRGLSERTVDGIINRLRPFFKMLRFDHSQKVLTRLRHSQIDAFIQIASKTNNRFSLQHVVTALRGYCRFLHARGIIPRPLHEQIDTPRIYRLERLPRAAEWSQVQALLRSINQNGTEALRDFTILYLAAAYGLRSCELVTLKLEDIDWHQGLLRVPQTKTKQTLNLPLTDEAGDVLCRYLRSGRPLSNYRELFLRLRAPAGPLGPTAVREILEHRIRDGGLRFPSMGVHALRHSFALRLLQSNVAMKTIGDLLGHRDPDSTAVYLRLGVADLREVGLPVPRPDAQSLPINESAKAPSSKKLPGKGAFGHPQWVFSSRLGRSMQRYLAIKCALGRTYTNEKRTLLGWDCFLHRRGVHNVSQDSFRLWSTTLDHLTPTVRRSRMRIVRNFLLFHAREHPGYFVPDKALFPKPHPKHTPRLISESEMSRLLRAIKHLPRCNNPFRAETMRIAFVLLYCCGLRRGELLRLRLQHCDLAKRLLRIERTKFHKSRLVPFPSSVADELQSYLQFRRKNHLPMEEDSFLIWNRRRRKSDTGFTGTGLRSTWGQLCRMVGVFDPKGRCARIHDLRHSFAVNALQRWYVQGEDVQAKLPHLATYMGHVCAASTHYYLHLTPELRKAANERFNRRFAPLFAEGGVA